LIGYLEIKDFVKEKDLPAKNLGTGEQYYRDG
jgi:hypothetical protein